MSHLYVSPKMNTTEQPDFDDKFIAFIDILGFKAMVKAAEVDVQRDAEGNTCQTNCGPLSLCPEVDFDLASVEGTRRIRLTWGNMVRAWDRFRLQRGEVVVAEAIDPSLGSFVDA